MRDTAGKMKGAFRSVLTTSVIASVLAQDTTAVSSLTPAATTVTASATAAPSLFESETIQLTDECLDDVAATLKNDTLSNMFQFADSSSNSSVSKRSAKRSCKVMPGDFWWPVDLVWDIFDLLLGDRLIKASPLAAACYPDWPEYDADKCTELASQWTSADLQ